MAAGFAAEDCRKSRVIEAGAEISAPKVFRNGNRGLVFSIDGAEK